MRTIAVSGLRSGAAARVALAVASCVGGLLAGLSLACGGAPAPAPPAKTAPATGPASPARPAPPAKPTFPGVPATPAGNQLAWVLDMVVHRHGKLDRAELLAHFHKSFLADTTTDEALKIFEQLGAELGSLALASVEGTAEKVTAHAVVGEGRMRIVLALDPATRQISGLVFEADADVGERPASFGDALRAAAGLAPRAQLLVAALDNGTCKPLQELAAGDELAIGSTFKLYVLLGLADRILAGKARWTDELAVRDDWKSLPSGTTQNEPPGTRHPLSLYAERMISISDNTAADHLIYTLGRKDIEAAVRASKHARPALDAPFLTTRELFVLKLGAPAELERYLKLPEAARRTYLDKTLATKVPPIAAATTWTTARKVDKLEWFASSLDLCHLMAALWTRGQDPRTAAVLQILAKNPGLPVDPKIWPYAGFKGGAEPGLINMTYLLRRDDNKWFVVTLTFNADEGGTLEDPKIFNLATGVLDLLAKAR
ncbi:MAG TPA: serine hydrolase [Kofleriaceae bacterium]|nr:serine hydrolase [Kofleriaceae bacterium]